MRAAPAVSVDASAVGWMLAALGLLSALVIAVGLLWSSLRNDALGWAVLLLVLAAVAMPQWQAWRRPPLRLRWDGQCWWLGTASAVAEPQAGDIAVAMDLGAFMLLRFRARSPAARPRHRWLPLQRARLPLLWHALRCAAYSPLPAATSITTNDDRG